MTATNIPIVEQLGLEIIFLFLKFLRASGFTSAITKGTSGSVLKCDVLSITIQPFFAAFGANSLEIFAPGEKIAISVSEKSYSAKSPTVIDLFSPKSIVLPFDREEANATKSEY